MNILRNVLVRCGLWLARCGGWQGSYPIADDLMASARLFVAHVDAQFAGQAGEFKRSQVLRALLNRHPDARERDCALAIEAAVRAR